MFETLRVAARVVALKGRAWSGAGRLAAVQEARFRRLLHHAVRRSPFYRERFRGIDLDRCGPADLPVLTKAEMMEHFDELVTDPRITRDGVERFMADPANVGKPYLGRYAVCHTSGSQGRSAVIVQERLDILLGFTAQAARGQSGGQRTGDVAGRLATATRIAVVTQRPGFYPSGAAFAYLAAARLPPVRLLRLSVFDPVEETVRRLNACRPHFLVGYASILQALAREEEAGHLRLRATGCLEQVTNVSEPLPPPARAALDRAFGVRVADDYAMGECMALTSGCPFHPGAHLNADLAILEVVDDRGRPVPAGQPGAKVYVTNLYNHVQPIIRYEVGDVVTMSATPCPCGSPLPLIESVTGRTKERFWLLLGGEYRELPYYVFLTALQYCLEAAEHQVLQTGVNRFVVRAAPLPGKVLSPERVERLVRRSLADEGLADRVDVSVEIVPEIRPDPVSGKLHRVRNLAGPPPVADAGKAVAGRDLPRSREPQLVGR